MSNRGESVLVCITFTYDDALMVRCDKDSDNMQSTDIKKNKKSRKSKDVEIVGAEI